MNQNFKDTNDLNKSPKPFSRSRFFSNIVAQTAGVYQFYNPIENGYYIGQSTNLADRFVKHSNDLFNNCHSNSGLQNTFNKILKDEQDPYQIITCEVIYQIDLMILPNNDKYAEIVRNLKNKESELITLYRQDETKKVYNFVQEKRVEFEFNLKSPRLIKKKPNKNVKPCEINNIQYSRIGQALAALKGTRDQVSRETLKKRLNDESFPTWKFLDTLPEFEDQSTFTSPEKISIDSKVNLPSPVKFTDPVTNKVTVFPSIRKSVDELNAYFNSLDKSTYEKYKPFNIKINNPSITRRCNKPSDYNNVFSWASTSEVDSFDFEKFLPKKLSGKNRIYSSVSEAAKEEGVSRLSIMNWCNNSQNNDWFYND